MRGPLDVWLVTETFAPEINGVARTLERWARGLVTRGHRLTVVRPRRRDLPDLNALPWRVHAVPGLPIPMYPALRFGLPRGRALGRLWDAHRPDVVHLATEGPLGLSALRAARRRGLAITSSFHTNFDSYSGFYGFPGASRSVAAYLRWFHNRTDRTLVPNPDLARRLEDIGHRAIETVGRGVDAALFDPARRSDALRRRWGVADDALAIGYFGRVAPEKNMATAMRAIDAACAAAPGAVGVMIGDGPLGERLRRRHPTVAHCGMRTGVDLAAHVASLDVVVLPSRTETFGNVVLEAMASGTAIVAFDAAAVRLHVRDDVDGRTVAMPARRDGAAGGRAADDAFVAAATALVRDPAAIARIRRAARATACRLSWTRIVDRFAQILVSASQMRPAPASDHASRAVARRDLRLLQ